MDQDPTPPPTDAPAAHTGTPQYGDFGHPADPRAPRAHRAAINDGSNDNPDEFSEFRGKHAAATEHYCVPGALNDPRYAGGNAVGPADAQPGS